MINLTKTEKLILETIIHSRKPENTNELSKLTGKNYAHVSQTLWQLSVKELLTKTRRTKSNKGFVYYYINEDNPELQEIITTLSTSKNVETKICTSEQKSESSKTEAQATTITSCEQSESTKDQHQE